VPAEAREIPTEIVTGMDEVAAVAQQARDEGRVALDTEFHWERTYAPQLCLLQIATSDRVVVLDPLAGTPVGPIAELLPDPSVEVVMHAPSADLLLFALRDDVLTRSVFDTQTVAGFVGLGAGLGYERLVDGALKIRLQHNETFSDWRRRPLTETQIEYAADDVRYLLPLADELRRRLERMGREQWAADELARRFGDPDAIVSDPERAYLKVQRRGRLNGRQLAVLRSLAAWREREARRRDLPAGWVVRDPSLVEIARAHPTDANALRRVRGLGSLRAADVDGLLDAVRDGLAAEPVPAPREPQGALARRAAIGSALGALLVRARCDAAGLAPELVATRADLEAFAVQAASGTLDGNPLRSGWRGDLVGRELEDLLAGRIALAATAQAPYLAATPIPAPPETA
jgi:ribonuclease D